MISLFPFLAFFSFLSCVSLSLSGQIKFLFDPHTFNEKGSEDYYSGGLSLFIDGIPKTPVGKSDFFGPLNLRWG